MIRKYLVEREKAHFFGKVIITQDASCVVQKLNDIGLAEAGRLPSIFLIFYLLFHQGKSKSCKA